MPIDFKILSMMDLRSTPGEILDRVAAKGESFIVERNGNQMACLVPLSVLMPDVQQNRLNHEFEKLKQNNLECSTSISDQHELEMRFRPESNLGKVDLIIRLPHGYPNVCPKVFLNPLPEKCPHRWQDGSLCIFGAMDVWNPGQHDVVHVLNLAQRWISNFMNWQKTGEWKGDLKDD